MTCKLINTNPYSGAGIIPFFEINLARHADLHQNGGFLVMGKKDQKDTQCHNSYLVFGVYKRRNPHKVWKICVRPYLGYARANVSFLPFLIGGSDLSSNGVRFSVTALIVCMGIPQRTDKSSYTGDSLHNSSSLCQVNERKA